MALIPAFTVRQHPLANAAHQRDLLNSLALPHTFTERVNPEGLTPLRADGVAVLQINLGKRCNQTCRHCHVDAGPDRQEVMPQDVVTACLDFLAASDIATLDITGGAPELHPQFRDIVRRAKALGRHVMDRCNLTILGLPAYSDLPTFFADLGVEIVASLPSPAAPGTDAQRGDGVFAASLAALKTLNALGYGQDGTGLILNLVTNPVGAFLPANQASLERDWKRQLAERYGIKFNRLYTITNMPISRYLEFLQDSGNLDAYMAKLVDAYNPAAVAGLMCRTTLSVAWDGSLHDCDFNQMLEIGLAAGQPATIFEARTDLLAGRPILTGPHCFGCTAGAGSSCGGTTVA
jgi:radical SAM/Cys-rich protein